MKLKKLMFGAVAVTSLGIAVVSTNVEASEAAKKTELMIKNEKTGLKEIIDLNIKNELGDESYFIEDLKRNKKDITPLSDFSFYAIKEDGEITLHLMKYYGDDPSVIIADSYDGYKVASISSDCFSNDDRICEVVLPRYLKSIPSYAFKNCVNLETVVISEGVLEIGNDAFFNAGTKNIGINNLVCFYSDVSELDLANDVSGINNYADLIYVKKGILVSQIVNSSFKITTTEYGNLYTGYKKI